MLFVIKIRSNRAAFSQKMVQYIKLFEGSRYFYRIDIIFLFKDSFNCDGGLPKNCTMNFKKTYFLILLIVMWGCSTKRNTRLSRGYHNLTAHYNVFFNGNESFKEGTKAIEDGNKDDYSQVLAVFPESKEGSEQMASSQMDRAIEKGTKLIKKHSIRKKPEKRRDDQSIKYKKFLSQNEFNKWVDNAYLLIGKSQFYKKEYYQAQQTFAYMFREFQTGPEWYEAEIWNARTALELNDFALAKILLEEYDLEGKAPSSLFGLFAATYADFYIRQEMYEKAIPLMKEAVEGAWSKYYRRRFNFILAQLYHKQGEYVNAVKAYEAVIKSNPPYEMAFNAKVNRAGILFEEGGLEAVKKEIRKLLRDKRNMDYEDQIYYALAMAYKAEEQEDLAKDNFLLSIERSQNNNHQKGLSYFEISEIYYDKPSYKPAFYYLDTAVVNLNETYPGLDRIKERHGSLSDLVDNINQVEIQDSLIMVASMPEQQKLAFIDQLIEQEKIRQEEEKKSQEEEQSGNSFYDPSVTQAINQQNNTGNWYFYNPTSVGMGKMEFEKRWGSRKLEDNWRRANKQVVIEEPKDISNPDDVFGEDLPGSDSIANEAIQQAIDKEKANDPLQREAYLKNLPTSPEDLIVANKKIQDGLLNQGLIYKDELLDIPNAIKAFDELRTRYPDGYYKEDALMNLYLCYEVQGDAVGMAKIKNQLIKEFPEGEFTAFLNDPDYFKKRDARNKQLEELYQQSYTDYLFNEFATPLANLEKAEKLDSENELLPKFKLLAALSNAKLGNLKGFTGELTEIKDNFPNSEVTPLAIEMLKLYTEGRTPVKGAVSSNLVARRNDAFAEEQKAIGNTGLAEDIATAYEVNHKAPHGLILLVNPEADLNRLKFNIADYNFSKFLLDDYEMGQQKLPDGTPVFTVSGFNNRLEALDYFYSIRERNEIFDVDELKDKKLYVIHDKNLEYLLSSGDKDGYDVFFAENYLSADAFENLKRERLEAERKAIEAERKKKEDEKRAKEEARKKEEETQKQNTQQQNVQEIAVPENQTTQTPVTETTQTKVEVAKENTTPSQESTFVFEQGMHKAIILFKAGHIDTKRMAMIFGNYTKNTFKGKYTVESGEKAKDYFYIMASGFASAAEAKSYLTKINSNSFLMREISRTQHYMWAITNDNYLKLTNESKFEAYQKFYKTNY